MKRQVVRVHCTQSTAEPRAPGRPERAAPPAGGERSPFRGISSVDVLEAGLRERVAHAVDVEPELAGGEPLARRLLLLLARFGRLRDRRRRASRGTTTTPSSSATIASPGSTSMPAQTTGTFTEPSVAFTVPRAQIARDQTGNFIADSVATSRTPASITSPRAPRARYDVASRSPNIPSSLSVVRRDDDDVARADHLGDDVQHPVVARAARAR